MGLLAKIFGPSLADQLRSQLEATQDRLAIAELDRDDAIKARDELRRRWNCTSVGWQNDLRDAATVRNERDAAERRLIGSLTPAMLRVACDMAGGLDLDEAVRPHVGMARRHLVRGLRTAGVIDGADNLTGFGFRAAVSHNEAWPSTFQFDIEAQYPLAVGASA